MNGKGGTCEGTSFSLLIWFFVTAYSFKTRKNIALQPGSARFWQFGPIDDLKKPQTIHQTKYVARLPCTSFNQAHIIVLNIMKYGYLNNWLTNITSAGAVMCLARKIQLILSSELMRTSLRFLFPNDFRFRFYRIFLRTCFAEFAHSRAQSDSGQRSVRKFLFISGFLRNFVCSMQKSNL